MGRFIVLFFALSVSTPLLFAQRAVVDEQFGTFTSGQHGVFSGASTTSNVESVGAKSGFASLVQSVLYQEMLKALQISPEISGSYCNDSSGSIQLPGTLSNPDITFSWQGPNGFSSSNWSIDGLEAGSYMLTLQLFHIKLPLLFEVPDLSELGGYLGICRVSADPDSSKMRIWFDDTAAFGASSYQIFRADSLSTSFSLIAELAAGSASFLDTLDSSRSSTYRYRVRSINDCGLPSAYSEEHQPFLLEAIESQDRKSVSLSWSPYIGQDYTTQTIYRSVDGADFEPLAVVGSLIDTFTDVSADTAFRTYAYYVESSVDDCTDQIDEPSVIRSNTATIMAAIVKDDDQDGIANLYDQCPDTNPGGAVDANGCATFSLPSDAFSLKVSAASCPGVANGSIQFEALEHEFTYHWSLNGGSKMPLSDFSLILNNLEARTYELCVYVDQVGSYKRCFLITVNEPDALSVNANVQSNSKTWALDLSGSASYAIKFNDSVFTTTKSRVLLPLKAGFNQVEVSTSLECQGLFMEEIFLSEKPQLYPNPTPGPLSIYVPGRDLDIELRVINFSGSVVLERRLNVASHRIIQTDLSALPKGIYLITLRGASTSSSHKLIVK